MMYDSWANILDEEYNSKYLNHVMIRHGKYKLRLAKAAIERARKTLRQRLRKEACCIHAS